MTLVLLAFAATVTFMGQNTSVAHAQSTTDQIDAPNMVVEEVIYRTNDTDVALSQGGEVDSWIRLSGLPTNAIITNVKYSLRVVHTQPSDVWIDLVYFPTGEGDRTSGLWMEAGGADDGQQDDDPETDDDIDLRERWVDTTFTGMGLNGDWDLVVYDDVVNGETGYIDYFYLWVYYVIPPANDDFDHATSINTLPYRTTQDTRSATAAADDPRPSCWDVGANVWYRFTPTTSSMVRFQTKGYSTWLALLTGTRGNLTEVGCNDYGEFGEWVSRVEATVTAGTTYYLLIGGDDSDVGDLTLDITPLTANCGAITQIPLQECQALEAFYNNTNGSTWGNWFTTSTPCTTPWTGLTCAAGHVTEIKLNQRNIQGTIPSAIGDLKELVNFTVYTNRLSGTVTPRFCELTKLQVLDFFDNQITGAIPTCINQMTALRQILINKNPLTGSLPTGLCSLSSLQALALSTSQLSGSVPDCFGNLTNLTNLWLNETQLAGSLPQTLVNLTKLQIFRFNTTALCEPNNSAFQSWLSKIPTLGRTNVLCAAAIDLAVTALTATTSPICAGATANFQATLRNNGGQASGAYAIRWQADNATVDGTQGSLAANTTSTVQYSWNNLPLGQHSLTFSADSNNQLTESDETNNQRQLTFTAVDCTPSVRFSTATGTANENDNTATIAVMLSAATSKVVTVDYSTSPGTAAVGSDYAATNGTLLFNPGETSKSVGVAIINDLLDEADETINLALSNPSNAYLGTPSSAIVTIVDNDEAPKVQWSTAGFTVNENGGAATLTAVLSAPSSKTITVGYTTQNGTASAGSDYTATSGTLTFAPGENSKTLAVALLDDTVDEPDETVALVLSNPQNATLGTPANSTITILDNDNPAQPTAAFTAIPTSGQVSLRVQFNDSSTGNITSWSWNFGDGNTSTERNPVHIYTTAGKFTVSLTVTGPSGSTIKTLPDYIQVSTPVPTLPVLNAIANTDGDGNFSLTWNAATNAAAYELQEQPSGGSWTTIYTGTALNYNVIGKAAGGWCYQVRATNTSGNSNWSSLQCTTSINPPETPALSPITPQTGDTNYTVNWISVAGATTYELQERVNDSAWTTIYNNASTSFYLTGKTSGEWCYQVRATNGGGSSNWSTPRCIRIPSGSAQPSLSLPEQVPAGPGSTVTLRISYDASNHPISSLLFSVDYDQSKLTADSNGDGAPDAILFRSDLPTSVLKSVAFDATDTDGELDFTIADFAASPQALPSGVIAEITLQVLSTTTPPAEAPVQFAIASFGSSTGDIVGVTHHGSVSIVARSPGLFLPLIRR